MPPPNSPSLALPWLSRQFRGDQHGVEFSERSEEWTDLLSYCLILFFKLPKDIIAANPTIVFELWFCSRNKILHRLAEFWMCKLAGYLGQIRSVTVVSFLLVQSTPQFLGAETAIVNGCHFPFQNRCFEKYANVCTFDSPLLYSVCQGQNMG